MPVCQRLMALIRHIKIAFVLLLVPTVACWYAFLGSGLRGEQSYSPARPMVFRRGTPSVVKELLSGFGICDCATGLAMARDPSHAGRQRRIGIHAGRWHAPACIWHRDCLLRCRIRDFLLRGALHVRHIPARMPRGGYAIDPMQPAPLRLSHESFRIQHCQRIGNSANAVRRLPSLGNWLAMPLTNCQPWMESFFC